jgi:hypothetical protein
MANGEAKQLCFAAYCAGERNSYGGNSDELSDAGPWTILHPLGLRNNSWPRVNSIGLLAHQRYIDRPPALRRQQQ